MRGNKLKVKSSEWDVFPEMGDAQFYIHRCRHTLKLSRRNNKSFGGECSSDPKVLNKFSHSKWIFVCCSYLICTGHKATATVLDPFDNIFEISGKFRNHFMVEIFQSSIKRYFAKH